jgi:hypothetical protein
LSASSLAQWLAGGTLVLFQIPNRAAPRFPSTVLVGKGVEQLVQCPCIAVEDKHVSIAVPIGAAFNGRVARDWVGARIAFFGVFEDDRHLLLVATDNHVRNADRNALPIAAEIRVKRFVEPDPGEDRVGIRIDRRAGDILVPRTVVRQEPSSTLGLSPATATLTESAPARNETRANRVILPPELAIA